MDLDDTLYSYKKCDLAGRSAICIYLANKLNLPRKKIQTAYNLGRDGTHKQLCGFAANHSHLLYIQKSIEDIEGARKLGIKAVSSIDLLRSYF